MRLFSKRIVVVLGVALAALAVVSKARAAEARPWLCRDKPVFSSDKPMTWDASESGGGRWTMIFMRFDPSGGHDGFTVFDTRDIDGRVTGPLEPGQWYAVGMYREAGRWICAAQAQENRKFVPGIVRRYCYGRSEGNCDVRLTVRESSAAPGAQ